MDMDTDNQDQDVEMPEYNKYERVKYPTDPRRCQSVTSQGQCIIVKMPGSDFCHLHAGYGHKKTSNYRLQRWQQRVSEMANNDNVKSLRDEIGILRMMLEEKLNQIETPAELMAMSHPISELVLKIEKLVISCHKLEKSMGELMDKSDILKIVESVISSIEELVDPSILSQLIPRIEKAIHVVEDV